MQDITGKWYGYPDLKNMRLRLEYHVEKAGGGYQVTLKIPDLSEKDLSGGCGRIGGSCFDGEYCGCADSQYSQASGRRFAEGTLWKDMISSFFLPARRWCSSVRRLRKSLFLSFGRGDFSECG